MDELIRFGALARVDPDPADELATWRADLEEGRIDDPAETRRRLDAQARGEQVIVRLELFADVVRDGRVERYDGFHVTGAWFEVGKESVNVAHAREMVRGHVDAFYRELTESRGVAVSYHELDNLSPAIEVDDQLSRLLAED